MLDFFPFYVQTNLSVFQILLCLILATGISYFFYRRTVPPLSLKYRIILGFMRAFSVFLIMIIIFAPDVTFVWKENAREKVVLAIDRSASMGLEKKYESAKNLAHTMAEQINDKFDVKIYYFDTDTLSVLDEDSINVSGAGTDISTSLSKILKKEKSIAALCLFSDGNITSGMNPLFSDYLKRSVIHTIGFGDSLAKPDIYINSVRANRIVYRNKDTNINVEIAGVELRDYSTNVRLKHNGKIIDAKKITINENQTIENVEFLVRPDKTGLISYDIEVSGPEDEEIIDNNISRVTMESLKSKLKIKLYASQPHYDIKFLKLLLSKDKDIELNSTVFVAKEQKLTGNSGIMPDSTDVLILHDFSEQRIATSIYSNIINTAKNQRIPVLYILSGRNQVIMRDNPLFPDLYISNAGLLKPLELQVQPTISGYLKPVLNIYDNEETNRTFWTKCPPLSYRFQNFELPAQYTILLQMFSDNQSRPVLLSKQRSGIRFLVLLGEGFWRWHFHLSDSNEFRDGWKQILQNMVHWLSQGAGSKNVILAAEQKIISIGETAILNTQVYDAAASPVEDGSVRMEISGPAGIYEIEAENQGDGIYSWDFSPIDEGEYSISAVAMKNDVTIGRDNLKIIVNPVEKEFIYTRQDKSLLMDLASNSGGNYYNPQEIELLIQELPYNQKPQIRSMTFEIWNKAILLAAILFFLSLEWFLRKRAGLS